MINLVIMAAFLKPVSAEEHAVVNDFLKGIITVTARMSLHREKIDCLEKLTDYSENEVMQFDVFGKKMLEKLKIHMLENHFSFKQ